MAVKMWGSQSLLFAQYSQDKMKERRKAESSQRLPVGWWLADVPQLLAAYPKIPLGGHLFQEVFPDYSSSPSLDLETG